MEKGTSSWDVNTTCVLINACLEQIYKKERNGVAFTPKGWKNIIEEFTSKTGKQYTKKQLKNRLDALKKEWKTWDDLFSKETRISFDWSRNMVIASDEWWDQKVLENRAYEKYRRAGLRYGKELNIIFKDVLASGDNMVAPSATQQHQQPVDLNEDDMYIPRFDLPEGSGDNAEDLHIGENTGHVGVTQEFQGFNLGTGTPASAAAPSATPPAAPSQSVGKRRRGEGSSKSTRKRGTPTQQLADAVSSIANESKERLDHMKRVYKDEEHIHEILRELLEMPEVVKDPDFSHRCCNMMMHPMPRIMFTGLRHNRDSLLRWLRDHAYSSPHYQKGPQND